MGQHWCPLLPQFWGPLSGTLFPMCSPPRLTTISPSRSPFLETLLGQSSTPALPSLPTLPQAGPPCPLIPPSHLALPAPPVSATQDLPVLPTSVPPTSVPHAIALHAIAQHVIALPVDAIAPHAIAPHASAPHASAPPALTFIMESTSPPPAFSIRAIYSRMHPVGRALTRWSSRPSRPPQHTTGPPRHRGLLLPRGPPRPGGPLRPLHPRTPGHPGGQPSRIHSPAEITG